MTEITAVSRERHANLTWQRPINYSFAAKDLVAALVTQEIARALMSMAIGFIASEGAYIPVAVQGLRPGQNKFVSRDGRWLGDYVPAVYRAYPFRLGRNSEGAEVLCVDEDAAQVSNRSDGEPFLLPDGTPAQAIAEAFNLLIEIEKDRQKTFKACAVLAKHQLIEPWALRAKDGEEILEAAGLFKIAEARLFELDGTALEELRDSGAMLFVFGQLFSMQQVHQLVKLGAPSSQAHQAPALNIFDQGGTISFANL